MTGKTLRGYRITKSGKVEKIYGYGLDASKRIKQKTSKRVRVTKRKP